MHNKLISLSTINKLLVDKSNNILIQLFRYTFVGGIAFLFDFGTLYILTDYLKVYYLLSAAIAFMLGLTINYILSIFWVFEKRVVKSKNLEFIIFMAIGLIGLGLNELIMWFLTDIIKFHYLISKIISTICVYFWNFFARKFALFN